MTLFDSDDSDNKYSFDAEYPSRLLPAQILGFISIPVRIGSYLGHARLVRVKYFLAADDEPKRGAFTRVFFNNPIESSDVFSRITPENLIPATKLFCRCSVHHVRPDYLAFTPIMFGF